MTGPKSDNIDHENECYVLQIEHRVQNVDLWKKTFDEDPANRQQSGVQSYTILKKADNTNYVQINLTFKSMLRVEEFHVKMRALWPKVENQLIHGPQVSIYSVVEEKRQ